MTWDQQIVEYNRIIVDYLNYKLNMAPDVQTAYRKNALFPIINRWDKENRKSGPNFFRGY
eukprot:4282580-Amphidinium_carterae.1